jgi:outer membrane cobalamin receptor
VLLDMRIGKRLDEHFELYVDGSNLLDKTYQEIAGVAMPGATVAISLAVTTR